jgi:hypothetical protein
LVDSNEFIERVRGSLRKDIYGLGEWREEVSPNDDVILISSPSWAGAYPWIDNTNNVYGFFLTHISQVKNGFNGFYASPVLPMMIGEIIQHSSVKK